MTVTYTYPPSAFLNGRADAFHLTEDVESSAITVALEGVTVDSSAVSISFKTSISLGEKSDLDDLVADHDGTPSPEESTPLPVIIEPSGSLSMSLVLAGGIGTILPGTTGNVDLTFSVDRLIQGANLEVTGAEFGDKIDVQVVHPLAGVVGAFTDNLYVPPSGKIEVIGEGASSIPSGLILRVAYQATSAGNTRNLTVAHRMWQ